MDAKPRNVSSRPERIGLFGGHFNPPHNGHVALVKAVLMSQIVDRVWVIPTYIPPHRGQHGAEYGGEGGFDPEMSKAAHSYPHRLQMTRLAFADMAHTDVLDIESSLQPPSYTSQTLIHLRLANPDTRFFLCIGEDSLRSFHTWHRFEEILDQVTLLVAQRPGVDHADNQHHGADRVGSDRTGTQRPGADYAGVLDHILTRCIFLDNMQVDISSTALRTALRARGPVRQVLQNTVPGPVSDYISHHKLSFDDETT